VDKERVRSPAKNKDFFFSSKASIKQWQGRRVLGCKKQRSRPLQNQQATSGKKENFDEQCQSKLQH
jgi:hypothetical protein